MDFINKGDKSVSLKNLVMQAGHELAMFVQQSQHVDWIDSQVEHYYGAKCLIEIAETMVCGSVGGFDAVKVGKEHIHQQPNFGYSNWAEDNKYDDFFTRWLWLYVFYVGGYDNDNVRFGTKGWYTIGDLKKHFKKKKR